MAWNYRHSLFGAVFLSGTILGMLLLTSSSNSMEPRLEGCQKICIPGPEDLVLDRSSTTPFLLVSSMVRPKGGEQDGIYVVDGDSEMDLITPPRFPLALLPKRTPNGNSMPTAGPPSTIHPQGIDIVQKESGDTLLYVVSKHDPDTGCTNPHLAETHPDVIRIYTVHYEESSDRKTKRPTALELLHCYRPSGLTGPNDITATPNGDIYVTNPTAFSSDLGIIFVNLTGWSNGSVFHFSQEKGQWTELITDLSYPNGIALVESEGHGKKLFVATTGDNKIRLFDISQDGAKTSNRENWPPQKAEIEIKRPDNLTVDRDQGMLWVTSPLSSFKYFLTFLNNSLESPWAVYAIDPIEPWPTELTPIGINDGVELNQPSVVVPHEGKKKVLYVGQIFGPFLYQCPYPGVPSTTSLPGPENSSCDGKDNQKK